MKSALRLLARFLPLLAVLAALGALAPALIPPGNPGSLNVEGFARLPVLSGGRMKPLDTVARSALLQIQHRQEVYLQDAAGLPPTQEMTLTPIEWLLDVFYRPARADTYRIFVVDNPDLLNLIGQTDESVAIHYPDTERSLLAGFDFMPSRWRRFSYRQIQPYLAKIENQAKLANAVDARQRTAFQRGVGDLFDSLVLYQRLENAVQVPGAADFVSELLKFQAALPDGIAALQAKEAGRPHNEALAQAMLHLGDRYAGLADATDVLAIPPPRATPDMSGWKTAGRSLLESFGTGQVDEVNLVYAGLGSAWRAQRADEFDHLISLYTRALQREFGPRLRKTDAEVRFNAAEPFYRAMPLFLVAFLLSIASWMFWPEPCRRAASGLVLLAWVILTAGIFTRMWLEGRPPVTNLYSSALFIGWGAVGLCLILEAAYKNAIGTAAAGVIGFGTLLIAQHLALSGDTMEMMRAVLDSNFWLATHVVVVTTGYASTFLAGFLALIYIVRGTLTRSLDPETALALSRMVYGIVCFATLFSFVGTVLGGIWADQSWGRFWGWDPKENGALIIVLWNALILHARWGGMVRQRGLMCLAVFGNIVTSWSWFGTNMLGIGLHSYGFTTAAFWSLAIFVASQLAFIALGLVPLKRWRSFRVPPKSPPPGGSGVPAASLHG
ncbi:MAG TPA: cytochrome c biogenesis protein CcsA [Opitutaceae bacterium]|jgi:ABC-type transport system involved in cytochrome c biogenesis permease subunit|nr:cytochrome c biogenesis protein CcsA [Opitutaceae bacterium]